MKITWKYPEESDLPSVTWHRPDTQLIGWMDGSELQLNASCQLLKKSLAYRVPSDGVLTIEAE